MCGSEGDPPSVGYITPGHLRAGAPCQAGSLVPLPAASGVAGQGRLVIEEFPVTFDGYTYRHSRIAYISGRAPCPLVLIHPNYAGLKQFDVDQAAFLAHVGYVGLALDMYKDTPEYGYQDRAPGTDPSGEQTRRHVVGAFTAMQQTLMKPKHWRGLMAAYLDAAQRHPAVRPGRAAAIGYCLGGQACLEQVRAGHQLQAVISFHGLLQSRPYVDMFKKTSRRMTEEEFATLVDTAPNKYNRACKVLIENGDVDEHVPQPCIDLWKAEMDKEGIDWRFNNHARTPHGFALAPGVWHSKYVEAADRRSTLSMLSLFAEVWPDVPQYAVECNACGTRLGQRMVPMAVAAAAAEPSKL